MPDDSFFANRPKKQQSLVGVPSGSLPRSPVSFSFSKVSLQIIIRSPHPRLGKFVFSDPKRVLQHYLPTAEVRRFTQSLRQREPAAMVAPYDRVGLAVRCAVVLSIPGHDQRWRFLSTSSARSACTVITNSLLITSSTVRSVSITNVTRCRGIIGIHPLTPNWRATT